MFTAGSFEVGSVFIRVGLVVDSLTFGGRCSEAANTGTLLPSMKSWRSGFFGGLSGLMIGSVGLAADSTTACFCGSATFNAGWLAGEDSLLTVTTFASTTGSFATSTT